MASDSLPEDYESIDSSNLRESELQRQIESALAASDRLSTTLNAVRLTHAQRQESNAYIDRLFENAHVLVVSLNREGRVEMLNQTTALLLGYDKKDLFDQDWFKIALPQPEQKEFRAIYRRARDGKTTIPAQFTGMIQTRSGELRHIEWYNSSLERDDRFAGCFAIGVDVTAPKLMEEALQASEMRYRRLFESAKDGILILNAESGEVDDVNPYLTELLGVRYDQLIGKRVWELGFLKDVAASRENFLELQQNEYIRFENLPLETNDGRRIDAEFVSNVYKVNGNIVIQCNIRNITARKQAEDELKVLHEELEQRIEDRTAELAQANESLQIETVKRMRAEEKQLTAVLDERTRIAREIHDTLAQGLAGIIIQLEAAEDVLIESPKSAHTHVIKARQLARDSLKDARRSMWALRPQMLELGDLAYAIGALTESMSKESSIKVKFSHQGDSSRLPRETEDGLLRICQEALMNAGKHSCASNIHVLLQFNANNVELQIEDDGQGFDVGSSVFLHGLGIRIMKERTAHLNGRIDITCPPGKGVKVHVQIPLVKTDGGNHHE